MEHHGVNITKWKPKKHSMSCDSWLEAPSAKYMQQIFFSLHSSAGPGLTGSGSHGLLAPVHPIWDGHIPWLTTMLALGSGENLPEPSPAGMALGAVDSQEWSWWQLLQGWNCKSNKNKMTPKKT
jgi:hypothetical protein